MAPAQAGSAGTHRDGCSCQELTPQARIGLRNYAKGYYTGYRQGLEYAQHVLNREISRQLDVVEQQHRDVLDELEPGSDG